MDDKGIQLLKLLFNEGETICVSDNEFGYHSIPLEKALDGEIELVSPNPNSPPRICHSSDLIFTAINPINGFRRDECSTAFRTFMWEIDFGSIPDQLGYFKKQGIPLSVQVFSGNKSVHAATILEEDLPNEKDYRNLLLWGLNIMSNCDQNCKNPSRSIRIPGGYREGGKKQRLISIGQRVKLKDFMDWLNKYPHLRPVAKAKREIPEGQPDLDRLSGWVRGMLIEGMTFRNGRNQTWFAVAVDFALAGYSEEQAIEALAPKFEEECDFKEKEWLTTITSGFRYAREGK